ncbi:MAG: hypothetical protein JW810_00385, partial [Sedimentisphaerales bacterium]|nr:hypothetical protein [Sedimentisphaerales bacterium]
LSEYFLYTIEGTETVRTGSAKRLASFTAGQVPVTNLYKFEQERYGDAVVRFLNFKNDKEHTLGETPIPGGLLKVYRTVDDRRHLSYEGQSSFKYIPVDQEVELNLGPVRDVIVEPKLMEIRTANYRFDARGNISGWDEIQTCRIRLKNSRPLPVTVQIRRNVPSPDWQITPSGEFGDYEPVDKDTVKFTHQLPPHSERSFGYVQTTYHGVRRQEARR